MECRADLVTARLNHSLDAFALPVAHRVAAGLDDAGLGRGDLLERVAQNLGVIETDVADDGGLGRQNHIRRVKFAAHADFADDHVAVLARKVRKADGGDELKLGWLIVHGVGQRLYGLGDLAQRLVRDVFAVDLDALVERDDIR